jgi:uncharacterized protein (DUF983 family)
MPEFPILVGHCDNGDPECCGIITPVVHGEQADLRCNECGVAIARVSAAEAEPTLLRMALSGGICSETCPHCGELNPFPGFKSMEAYTCRHCGQGVVIQRSVQ